MRGDAAGALVKNDFGNVFVAVVGVEQRIIAGRFTPLPIKRTRRHRFGRIPLEKIGYRIARRCVQTLKAKIAVVNEAMVSIGDAVHCF